jgi:hypothetical protein
LDTQINVLIGTLLPASTVSDIPIARGAAVSCVVRLPALARLHPDICHDDDNYWCILGLSDSNAHMDGCHAYNPRVNQW